MGLYHPKTLPLWDTIPLPTNDHVIMPPCCQTSSWAILYVCARCILVVVLSGESHAWEQILAWNVWVASGVSCSQGENLRDA